MAEIGGALAHHMAVHIVAMNVAAPAMVLAWRAFRPAAAASWSASLWPAAGLQLALLLGWHLPSILPLALASRPAVSAMHISLFLAALSFWFAIVDAVRDRAWNALAALLVTGKIFCLVGVLLAFAPRPLYAVPAAHAMPQTAAAIVADQQLAGLLMLIACPLAYVLAGIVVAARWLAAIDRQAASPAAS